MEEIKKKMREDFRSRFGRFYVSIDSKTKAIRIVDIENGTKVNGEDGSLIECVASNDIEKFIDSIIELAVSKERERIVGEVKKRSSLHETTYRGTKGRVRKNSELHQ